MLPQVDLIITVDKEYEICNDKYSCTIFFYKIRFFNNYLLFFSVFQSFYNEFKDFA